jgi:signal peptidase I
MRITSHLESASKATPSPSRQFSLKNFARELLETLLITGLLFLSINLFTSRIRVEGSSMEPTLKHGEFVVVNRLAYRWKDLQRGDIVVFYYPLDPERRFIKRVIGLPGDTVEMRDGQVWVNGRPLQETYIRKGGLEDGVWKVEEGHIFVLGDNRANSSDSRAWGLLSTRDVIGRAVLIYWPPDQLAFLPPFGQPATASEGVTP